MDNESKINFLGFLRLRVLELLQLFLFWLMLKTSGTSTHNAAVFFLLIADQTQFKIINQTQADNKNHIIEQILYNKQKGFVCFEIPFLV